jgi:hypothetical protein
VGPIAQLVEQRTFNPWVDGSSPSGPTFIEFQICTGRSSVSGLIEPVKWPFCNNNSQLLPFLIKL